jgi:putative lipoprotein
MRNAMRNLARLAVVALLSAFTLGGCALFEPSSSGAPVPLTGVLTGTASYRERIALLPGSVVRVSLEDVNLADAPAAVIASTAVLPERQVPIPFTLAYDSARIVPSHRYALRAQIESANGQRLWTTTERYGVITQGNPDHVDLILHPARAPAEIKAQSEEEALMGRTYAYQCEGMSFAARNGPGMVTLYLPDAYAALPQVRAASGVRYQEGDNQFWNKGNEVALDLGARHYTSCKLDVARSPQEDAKLRSVSLRAKGSEPNWTLDIDKGRWLRFVGDAAGASAYLPAQTSTIEGIKTVYRAKSTAHEMLVIVERSKCSDAAGGKNTDAKVTVTVDGREYRGCGQAVE